jgi:bifunctional NMN adenylyltransferase/nudix hydrolase
MKPKETTAEVGVIVGRFQVPELHEAHVDLIQSVINRHPKVIIFLGLSPCKTTYNNPLDFEARKQLILDKFPQVNVLYIKDERDDGVWSRKLDSQIEDILGANQKAVLYGSRDSFIPFYTTKTYDVIELEPDRFISGTEIRKSVSNRVKSTPDFRGGVIWGVNNQFSGPMLTVDIAVINEEEKRILLCRKPTEKQYRFVGGFVQSGEKAETAAKRELMEETGLETGNWNFVSTNVIDDWRYRKERNKVLTMLWYCKYIFGAPKASDDISEVRWFDVLLLWDSNWVNANIVEEHHVLVEEMTKWIEKPSKTL